MPGAYLQITLNVKTENRGAAKNVYESFREPFLESIKGAESKKLLVREEDVQVLHGFENTDQAEAYLESSLFKNDVFNALKTLLSGEPEIRIYSCA